MASPKRDRPQKSLCFMQESLVSKRKKKAEQASVHVEARKIEDALVVFQSEDHKPDEQLPYQLNTEKEIAGDFEVKLGEFEDCGPYSAAGFLALNLELYKIPSKFRDVQSGDSLEGVLLDKFPLTEIIRTVQLWTDYPSIMAETTERHDFQQLSCHLRSDKPYAPEFFMALARLFDSRSDFFGFCGYQDTGDSAAEEKLAHGLSKAYHDTHYSQK